MGVTMMLEEGFVAYTAQIQSLVEHVGDRIRPMRANQHPVSGAQLLDVGDKLPFITYQNLSNPRTPCLGGATTLGQPRLQVDIHARTYASAKAIADIMRNHFDGYRGWMGSVYVNSCVLEDEHDFNDESPSLDGAATVGVSQEFAFQHQESLPSSVPPLE